GVAEEVGPHGRPGSGELLGEDHRLHGGQALAAVLLGPRCADPTAGVELLGPFVVEPGAVRARELEALVEPAVGQVLLEPGADLGAEGLGLRRVRQVHAPILTLFLTDRSSDGTEPQEVVGASAPPAGPSFGSGEPDAEGAPRDEGPVLGAAAFFFLGGGTPTLTEASAESGQRRRLTIDRRRIRSMAPGSSSPGRAMIEPSSIIRRMISRPRSVRTMVRVQSLFSPMPPVEMSACSAEKSGQHLQPSRVQAWHSLRLISW